MPTLQELIEKATANFIHIEELNDFYVILKEDMEEFGKTCYMEGVNSGMPWGGSKVDHYENFIKQE